MNTANLANVSAEERVCQAIRSLVGGAHPDTLAGAPLASFGQWGSTLGELIKAHEAGGTDGVMEAYLALVKTRTGLMNLMCGDHPGRQTTFTMRELATKDFPPLKFLVPGLIPVGLTIVAGRPKIGKSLVMMDLAIAADTGGEALGIRVPQTKVFYLALEDTEHRLADRIKKMAADRAIDWGKDGESVFCTEWPAFSGDGLEALRKVFEQGFKLVIVDTLSRAAGRVDQMDPQDMTRLLGAMQRMAASYEASLVLVDHHRKSARTSPDADPIDDILGSTAKAGVVDCAIGLYRRHNEDEAVLRASGRDFGDQELKLAWDAEHFRWHVKDGQQGAGKAGGKAAGKAATYTLKEQETIDAVAQLGEGTLGQIVQALGQNKGSVHRRLQNLCGRGALAARQTPKGVTYRLAAVETVETVEAVEVVEAVETVEVVEAVETVEVVEVVEVVGAVEALAQAQDCDYNEGAYPLPASPDAARPPARWCGERPAPTTVRKVTV